MKQIHILTVFILALASCNSTTNSKGKSDPDSPVQPLTGKKFFEYDRIVHYFNPYDESNLKDLYNSQTKSEIDSIKKGVIVGHIPTNIFDLSFIDKLERIGYKNENVDKSKFGAIDNIFTEKVITENLSTACISIYRDILIFKKQSKVIGTAKICFECMDHQITGTNANTGNFGQDGDYSQLQKILRK